jgi:low temperature requirement protein LtrA
MLTLFQSNTAPDKSGGTTWLSLFFDLIYVAILIELGHRYGNELTVIGTFNFLVMFVLIWWSWLGLVFYTRFFPADDIGQRILTIVYMVLMVSLAFEIHSVTAATATLFTLSYAATKFVLALMYARAWQEFPAYRAFAGHYAILNLILGLIWIVIATVAPNNFTLWIVAAIVDITLPLTIILLHKLRNRPLSPTPAEKHHHMLHRFGELTIIVLGEFFIKLVSSSSEHELELPNLLMGACMLAISVSMWWLYFDHTSHVDTHAPRSRPTFWIYTHYFLLAGITAYGVVGTKVYATLPNEVLADEKRIVLCSALAIATLALGIIDWASPEEEGAMWRKPQLSTRAVAAAILLLLAVFGSGLTASFVTTIVTTVLVLQVVLDIAARLRNRDAGISAEISPAPTQP